MNNLFSPLQVGTLVLNNRLVFPPMATGKSEANGLMNNAIIDYYNEKSQGGFLNQFLSPLSNKRNDEYGGDIHNRIRIHLEIIKEVRTAVGLDFQFF